jgi:very-short-patch-repair endonuclease
LALRRAPGILAGVARRPLIPTSLTKRPFTLEEALAVGVTKSMLRGRSWLRIGSQLYRWSGAADDYWRLLGAWQRRLPADIVFAGTTAAWMLGLDFRPADPVEIAVSAWSGIRRQSGLSVRRAEVPAGDIVAVRGLRATSLFRTLCDLCLRWPPVEALVALDMAVASGLTVAADLNGYAEGRKSRAGARRLRELAVIAAPAESPMETRLRWLVIQAGRPHPEVQAQLCDHEGRFVGRADLYYPSARLVLEYDGTNHRTRMIEDNRRQNLLLSAGFGLLRFTAADIYDRPGVIVAQVRAALA